MARSVVVGGNAGEWGNSVRSETPRFQLLLADGVGGAPRPVLNDDMRGVGARTRTLRSVSPATPIAALSGFV